MMRAGQASPADKNKEPQRGAEQDSRLHFGSHAFLAASTLQDSSGSKEARIRRCGLLQHWSGSLQGMARHMASIFSCWFGT